MARDEREKIDEINCSQPLFHHNYSHNITAATIYIARIYYVGNINKNMLYNIPSN